MKYRRVTPKMSSQSAELELCAALLSLQNVDEMRAFLHDLCTAAELEALIDRWSVVPFVLGQVPYRQIHQQTAVSVTTIGRVAYFLRRGSNGYQTAAGRMFDLPTAQQRGGTQKHARPRLTRYCTQIVSPGNR